LFQARDFFAQALPNAEQFFVPGDELTRLRQLKLKVVQPAESFAISLVADLVADRHDGERTAASSDRPVRFVGGEVQFLFERSQGSDKWLERKCFLTVRRRENGNTSLDFVDCAINLLDQFPALLIHV